MIDGEYAHASGWWLTSPSISRNESLVGGVTLNGGLAQSHHVLLTVYVLINIYIYI